MSYIVLYSAVVSSLQEFFQRGGFNLYGGVGRHFNDNCAFHIILLLFERDIIMNRKNEERV